MKRDIRINYSVLERISLNIKKYKNAIETIRQVLSFVNNKLESENQGEAIEALKGNYSELEGDLEGCQEELNDLYTIFDGYISEMQDIIRPVSSSNMMQVDRNDIWWNMESIFQACDEVGILKINVGTGMSLPNLFQSAEDKANAQKNSRMMEDIGDDIKYCYNKLNDNKDDLKNIYDKKIVPYENKDDEYSNKAGKLYFKYTNTWESTVESVKDFGLTGINVGKGLVDLAADVLKGGYGLAKGAVVVVGAGVAMKSMMETGDAPDCLKKCITKTEGYGKTVSSVLKDPVILAEGIAQGASDTIEEKGIAYYTSYVLGGVLLTKGLSKVSSGFKAGEVVDVSRIDYLRGKYGKLSSIELNGKINVRGINEEARIAKIAKVAEDDKKAVLVTKWVGKTTDDLLKETTCSTDKLHQYLKSNDDYLKTNYAHQYFDTGKWPDDIQIPKSSEVLTSTGSIEWGQVPDSGYVLDSSGKAIKDTYFPKKGEAVDRYGPSNGTFTSPVIDGKPYSYGSRSLPYINDLSKYHQYEFTDDLSKLSDNIKNCTDKDLVQDINDFMAFKRIKSYDDLISYKGEIASGFGVKGRGIQYQLPLPVDILEELGVLKIIK